MAKNQTLTPYLDPASKQSNSKSRLLRNVRNYVEDYKFLTNWYSVTEDGWTLPSVKEPHDWCGLWQTFGCLNHHEHEKLGKGNRVYIKQFQRSCYRATCIECYLNWIRRQADASTQRIEHYSKLTQRTPVHLLFSVHVSQYHLPEKQLRKRLMAILKKISFIGGAIIFHPFRFNKTSRRWYYAPHYHIVGFTWKIFLHRGYGMYGWYVKDLSVRESVFQTFCYLLSHCGIKKGIHAVSWTGWLSYSKLKIEKEPKITCCPVCGGEFVPVYYDGFHPIIPPDKNYEGLIDNDGEWYQVKSFEYETPSFEFASTRVLNDVLVGLSL